MQFACRQRRSYLRFVAPESFEQRLLLSALGISPPPPNRIGPQPAFSIGTAAKHPLTSLPALNSLPGATASLYLDFNGHFEATWGSYSNLTTPVYSSDTDLTTFNDAELAAITEIWKRVSEDFAPFKINVTTVQPSSFANGVAMRVAIGGGSSDWYGASAGGVGYIDTFTNDTANTVYVFAGDSPTDLVFIAEASSHEAGHGFGLEHQSTYTSGGTKDEEYNPGGAGWAPIMGLSYYEPRTTWHNGTSAISSTSFQDDMALLARTANGFGYRTDAVGSNFATSVPLTVSGNSVSASGIIEQTSDFDSFRFSTGAGAVSFSVSPAAVGPNLIVKIELRTSTGSLIASSNGGIGTPALLSRTLAAGDYQLRVTSNGTYGSVGQYSVSGTVVPPAPSSVAIGVFRAGSFYLDQNGDKVWNGVSGGDVSFGFGQPGDLPVAGDWNGDGRSDIALYRDGYFYLDLNGNRVWNNNGGGDLRFRFGNATDHPVSGDWDGDGTTEIGVCRNGKFYLDLNGNRAWDGAAGGDLLIQFGTTGDLPVTGDWNGDGATDIGIFRAGKFYLDLNGNRAWNNLAGGDAIFNFGTNGDKPAAGDWNGDGKDEVAILRAGTFYVDANGNRTWDNTTGGDLLFRFGNSGDLPLMGVWSSASPSPPSIITATPLVPASVAPFAPLSPTQPLAHQLAVVKKPASSSTIPASDEAESAALHDQIFSQFV